MKLYDEHGRHVGYLNDSPWETAGIILIAILGLGSLLPGWVVNVIGILFYFIPFLVSLFLRKGNVIKNFLYNFFLGWTIVFWVIQLIQVLNDS